jgi:hypothetical protein
MTLQDFVAEYIDKPARELTIEQIRQLLTMREAEEKAARFLAFVPDKESFAYRRGHGDAMAGNALNQALETESEQWNYNAGYNDATHDKGMKKIGL